MENCRRKRWVIGWFLCGKDEMWGKNKCVRMYLFVWIKDCVEKVGIVLKIKYFWMIGIIE